MFFFDMCLSPRPPAAPRSSGSRSHYVNPLLSVTKHATARGGVDIQGTGRTVCALLPLAHPPRPPDRSLPHSLAPNAWLGGMGAGTTRTGRARHAMLALPHRWPWGVQEGRRRGWRPAGGGLQQGRRAPWVAASWGGAPAGPAGAVGGGQGSAADLVLGGQSPCRRPGVRGNALLQLLAGWRQSWWYYVLAPTDETQLLASDGLIGMSYLCGRAANGPQFGGLAGRGAPWRSAVPGRPDRTAAQRTT